MFSYKVEPMRKLSFGAATSFHMGIYWSLMIGYRLWCHTLMLEDAPLVKQIWQYGVSIYMYVSLIRRLGIHLDSRKTMHSDNFDMSYLYFRSSYSLSGFLPFIWLSSNVRIWSSWDFIYRGEKYQILGISKLSYKKSLNLSKFLVR